ncbi:MAG: peptidase S8 [Marteilia pararefringens]
MCRRKSTEEAKKKSKRCCTADFCCILCHLGTFGLIIASLIVLASEMGDLRDKLQKYEANGNTEVITCPIEGQVPSRSGRHCQCEDNRLLLHLNLLSCEPSCGVNEVASDNDDIKKCICQNGFKIEKTTQGTERCVACFLTEKTFNNECFPVCPDGTVEDPNKRECLCAKKDSLNHKGKCICREYRLLDGTCGDSCGIHQASRMDSGEKVCECSEGYSKNAAGQCECNTGMIDSQGSCRRECNSPMVLMADDFRQIKVCRCEDKAKQPRRVDGIEKCVCPRFENKDVGCVNDCGEREIAIVIYLAPEALNLSNYR